MSSSEEYSFQGDNTDNTQRSNCTQISVVAKRTRVRKLDNSKVATECGEKKCGRIPDIKKRYQEGEEEEGSHNGTLHGICQVGHNVF